MSWDKLKELVWAGALILVIGAAYMEWRISEAVDEQFASAGLVKTEKITDLENDISEAKAIHVRDADRMDAKVEKIVDILLAE